VTGSQMRVTGQKDKNSAGMLLAIPPTQLESVIDPKIHRWLYTPKIAFLFLLWHSN